MNYIVDNTDGSGKLAPRLIERFNDWVVLHLQGAAAGAAGTIRISRDQYSLQVTSANNLNQGLKIQQSDGIKSLMWVGELWAIGDTVQSTFDLEVMQVPNFELMTAHRAGKLSDAMGQGYHVSEAQAAAAPRRTMNELGSAE